MLGGKKLRGLECLLTVLLVFASSATLATPQSRANDGSAACASLDCGEHGALNRATLQAQFPGLSLAAAVQARQTQQQQQQQSGFGPKRQTSDAPASATRARQYSTI